MKAGSQFFAKSFQECRETELKAVILGPQYEPLEKKKKHHTYGQ